MKRKSIVLAICLAVQGLGLAWGQSLGFAPPPQLGLGYYAAGGVYNFVATMNGTNALAFPPPSQTIYGYNATGIDPLGATYTSGITATGSLGQTCTLTVSGGTANAVGTVALSGANTVTSGTAIIWRGSGLTVGTGFSPAPTSATASNGTATCSGTAVIVTTLGAYAPLTVDGSGNFGTVSFSGGATGLTPNTPTLGAIVLNGTLNAANGGTGVQNLAPSLDNTGASLQSTGGQSVAYGYVAWGDSYTSCAGATIQAHCYPGYIQSDTSAALTNRATGGDDAADEAYRIFYYQDVLDSGVPWFTYDIGQNDITCSQDAGTGITSASCQLSSGTPTNPPAGTNYIAGFTQYVTAALTRLTIGDSNVVRPQQNTATITFLAPCVATDTYTINGTVVTVVASGATGNQINAGTATACATNLYTLVLGSGDANLVKSVPTNPTAGVVVLTPANTAFQQTVTTNNWGTVSPLPQLVVQSANWTAFSDTLANPGLQTSTPGSTLTDNAFWAPSGVFYVWYAVGTAQGGTFTVKIDGVAQTDTILSSATMNSTIIQWAPKNTGHGGTETVAAARFTGIDPTVTHTLLITSTSGTNAILGAAAPAGPQSRGTTGPNVTVIDPTPKENLLTACASTPTAYCPVTYDTLISSIVTQLSVIDGLNISAAHWLPQTSYNKGFLNITPAQNCPGQTSGDSNHPGDCQYRIMANAAENAAKVVVPAPSASLPIPPGAPADITQFPSFNSSGVQSTTALNPGFNFNQCTLAGQICYGFTMFNTLNVIQPNYSSVYTPYWYSPAGTPIALLGNYPYNTTPNSQTGTNFNQPALELDGSAVPVTFLPVAAAASNSNKASTTMRFRGSGWSGSAAPANEDWTMGLLFDAGTHTANSWVVLKNTVQNVTDTANGFWWQNTNAHGIKWNLQTNATYDYTMAQPTIANAMTYNFPVINAITSATGGTNTGTVTCTTAACTNISGTYSVVGSTFTTGTFLTLVWPTTTTAYRCWTAQNGGIATYGIGHAVATATGMVITSGITPAGVTVTIDYGCSAN